MTLKIFSLRLRVGAMCLGAAAAIASSTPVFRSAGSPLNRHSLELGFSLRGARFQGQCVWLNAGVLVVLQALDKRAARRKIEFSREMTFSTGC